MAIITGNSTVCYLRFKKIQSFSYRQNASPIHEETHKFAQDYHMKSVAEKRMASQSPSFNDRSSPSYLHRTSSPSYVRASSPNYPTPGRDTPDYISSKKLNEKRYDVSSPSYVKKSDFDTNYASTKMSSMRLSDSRSPNFIER